MYIDLQEYESFRASPFLEEGIEVCFPHRATAWTVTGSRAVIQLEAIVCRKQPVVISALMYGRDFHYTGKTVPMYLAIDFYQNGTLRLQLSEKSEIPDRKQLMIEAMPVLTDVLADEDELAIIFRTDSLTVRVQKTPYGLTIFDRDGKRLYQQYTDDAHNVTNDRRRGHREGDDTADDADVSLQYPGFETFPFGKVTNSRIGEHAFTESVLISPGESFYGFGERFSPLDKNGQELLNWVVNPVGVSNSKAYKCIPFFYSSRGYGVYYNTPRKIRFSMGNYYYKAYEVQVSADELDLFFFAGSQKTVLRQYSALTGHCAMPPKWAFGVWMSRNCYMSQNEVESVARELREKKLPCDVMHIDWAYCKTFDYDFAFDRTRFPDVEGMCERLLNMDIRLSVWQLPYIKTTSDVYPYAKEHGFLAMEKDGSVADSEAGEAVIDFSNPEAVRWYQDLLKGLLRQGIRVIKSDFGENAQDSYCYSRIDGADMHNLYPLMYNRAAYEAAQEIHPGDSLIWGRSAYAGCQRYPVYWGGDSDSDYNGMYHSLRGGLSLGLSGFPFWSHDVGGYFGTPEKAVYIRWLQFGMFSPLVRFHGTSAREPWAFGKDAEDIYRQYAGYRYSLMEYLASEARTCIEEGLPMLRALVLEYPDDPAVRKIDDEYLLGSAILAAPVFSDEPHRTVYLPQGNCWYDFHTGKRYEGGQYLTADTPIEIMPIYYRGGTAVPKTAPLQHVDLNDPQEVVWEIYPERGRAEYTLKLLRSEISLSYEEVDDSGVIVVSELCGVTMHYKINSSKISRLIVNGRKIPVHREQLSILTV